jgi:hypothetical protein
LFDGVVAVIIVEDVAMVAVDLMVAVDATLGDGTLEFLNAAAWEFRGELAGGDGTIEGGAGRRRLGSKS